MGGNSPCRSPRPLLGAAAVLLLAHTPLTAQATRAERTDFRETSSYADVMGFLDSLQRSGASIRIGTLATSVEGRRVPYVIAARPMVTGPAEARRSGKPLIYLQGNIHAGEVEGKEAVQMLVRDLTLGPLRRLLDSVIVLAVPIYNADGNERLAPGQVNRPGQHGPAMVGRNPNGQELNLNRDYVKMEAPETRGAAELLKRWDPELFVDLHTTNGSYHGYVLTYAPGLNSNVSPAAAYVREQLLPAIRDRMQRRHSQATFWYGNFRNQEPDSLAQGWETYDARPRFGTNWMGLRGRLAILSEGYSNAEFRTRVQATYNFVREVLSLAAERRDTIRSLAAAGDRWAPDSVAVRSVLGQPTEQEVVAEITRSAGQGSDGYAPRRRTGVFRAIRMPVFDGFAPARKEARPAGYLLPERFRDLVDLLRRQGISVERLTAGWQGRAEQFAVDSLVVEPLFEGHRTIRAEGQWTAQSLVSAAPGWYFVRTAQPLGVLAVYLLEPASEDGVVTWNLLDRELAAGWKYPIVRLRQEPRVVTELVP